MTFGWKSRIGNFLQATAPAAIVGVCLESRNPVRDRRDRTPPTMRIDAFEAPGDDADGFARTSTPAGFPGEGDSKHIATA